MPHKPGAQASNHSAQQLSKDSKTVITAKNAPPSLLFATSWSDFCKVFECMSLVGMPKSAGFRVAATPELLEMILLEAAWQTNDWDWLVRVQRASSAFYVCILGSPDLQWHLAFYPPSDEWYELPQDMESEQVDQFCDCSKRSIHYAENCSKYFWTITRGPSKDDPDGQYYIKVEFEDWVLLGRILANKEASLRRRYFQDKIYCVSHVRFIDGMELRDIKVNMENCTAGALYDAVLECVATLTEQSATSPSNNRNSVQYRTCDQWS